LQKRRFQYFVFHGVGWFLLVLTTATLARG
jgi:hypothetical protein